jgi:hypothetical protein
MLMVPSVLYEPAYPRRRDAVSEFGYAGGMKTASLIALALLTVVGCGKKPAPAATPPTSPSGPVPAAAGAPVLEETPLRLVRRKVAQSPMYLPLVAYLHDEGAGALKPIRHRIVFADVVKESRTTNLNDFKFLDLKMKLCNELAEEPQAMLEYLEGFRDWYNQRNKDAEVDSAAILKGECKLSDEEAKLFLDGR